MRSPKKTKHHNLPSQKKKVELAEGVKIKASVGAEYLECSAAKRVFKPNDNAEFDVFSQLYRL